MDLDRIGELLHPFLGGPTPAPLLAQFQAYLSLLIKWNQRIALTAVRDEENIVTRHFGESLFAARCWFPSLAGNDVPRGTSPDPNLVPRGTPAQETTAAPTFISAQRLPDLNVPRGTLSPPLVSAEIGSDWPPTAGYRLKVFDIGSGAGFPGIPLKLYTPEIQLSLVEAHGKKATFLREVIRTLALKDATVLNRRAEDLLSVLGSARPFSSSAVDCSTWNASDCSSAPTSKHLPDCSTRNNSRPDPDGRADLVTLRAVEQFADILPIAAALVRPFGRLGLLISSPQVCTATSALQQFQWFDQAPIPLSANRVVLTGTRQAS